MAIDGETWSYLYRQINFFLFAKKRTILSSYSVLSAIERTAPIKV